MCIYVPKLSQYGIILQSYCTSKKGAIFNASQCSITLVCLVLLYTVSGKNGPPKKNAVNAQYITQSNKTYTALFTTHLGIVSKISMNCVSRVVRFVIFYN